VEPATSQFAKLSPFLAWTAVCSLAFITPLIALGRYALSNDSASHILLVPFIVAFVLYGEKHTGKAGKLDLRGAALIALPAILLCVAAVWPPQQLAAGNIPISLSISALVLLLICGFVALYGRRSAVDHSFALAFLLFFIPIPDPVLNRIIYFLQVGSADIAESIFDITGTPALRQDFVFHLPTVNIEVAQECSGIRSSVALLILALLVAHFTFSKTWKKVLFVVAGLVMMVVKNGVRIATLTILANSVNPDFLFGRLHRDGGVVFFLVGLVLLWPVHLLLRRGEEKTTAATSLSEQT